MATTPNGIPLLDGTSQVNPIQTPINAALNAVDAAITTGITGIPKNYLVGTNAQRLALTGVALFEGLRFYATDTNIEWFHTGAAWVINGRDNRLVAWNTNTPVVHSKQVLIKNGLASGTTGATGVLSTTFSEAFASACVAVVLMPDQNSNMSAWPVLVEASVGPTGFQTLWGNKANSPVRSNYIAFGY